MIAELLVLTASRRLNRRRIGDTTGGNQLGCKPIIFSRTTSICSELVAGFKRAWRFNKKCPRSIGIILIPMIMLHHFKRLNKVGYVLLHKLENLLDQRGRE